MSAGLRHILSMDFVVVGLFDDDLSAALAVEAPTLRQERGGGTPVPLDHEKSADGIPTLFARTRRSVIARRNGHAMTMASVKHTSTRRRRTMSIMARWLALTLLGWVIYAMVRALWTTIYLGAPLYDWQWYLAIVGLLVGLCARIARCLPRSKMVAATFGGLLIWAVVGYGGFWQTVHLYPAHVPPVPISFWASSAIGEAQEAVLQDLRTAGGWLYVTVDRQPFDEERRQILIARLRRLAAYDIEVYLAPYLPDFLSVPVHDEWIANVWETAALVHDEDLTNVHGVIGDAERPFRAPFDFLGIERDAFLRTMCDLDSLVRQLRREYPDFSAGVTAGWPLHVDGLDGDPDLSITYRSPVDPPGNWGFVNVMTYSSYFPPSWRAYYVYLTEQMTARRYPDCRPSHLIGLVGGGFAWEPLLDFDDLVRDARLSRALGVREIVVFQLTDALMVFGDDFVGRLAAAVNDTPSDLTVEVPFSRPISVFLYSIAAADALLDARGWRGLLLFGWMAASAIIACRSVRRAS